jgi:predicted dehydrogenase
MAKGWLKAIADTPEIRSAVTVVGLVDVNPAAAKALAE